jgi:lipoate-protein ligase A
VHNNTTIHNERRNNLKTTQILNESHKKGGKTLLRPQRKANNTPISRFDRRDTEAETSAVQDFTY